MNRNRNQVIVRTSFIGIAVNVLLAAFKLIVGVLTHSIAITLDAVNNISDAASSVITIVGTKLAGKAPDKKHPFGHGRVEYLTALVIAVIVLFAGITSLQESVKAILHPGTPEYSAVSLVIVAVAVVVKILLGSYCVGVGKKVDSDSLINSGEDARLDSVISLSTLVAAGIYLLLHISLEAWLGAAISVVIIKSGIDMLRTTISRLLGESVDAEMARAIAETIKSFPGVNGAYDLILNDYGPDTFHGSVHIEVPDTFTASELDELIRSITLAVLEKHHVILTAVGVYSINTTDAHAIEVRETVSRIAVSHEYITQIHGFYLDDEKKTMRFDLVVSFDAADRREVYEHVKNEIHEMYPDYSLSIAMDTDFIES